MTERQASISVSAYMIDGNTPELPDAKRGAVSESVVAETDAQLKAGLVWWLCGFCGRFVLIDAFRNTHEKCSCGAERRTRHGNANWLKDGETIEYC